VAEHEYDASCYQERNEREETTAESPDSRQLVIVLAGSGHPVSDACVLLQAVHRAIAAHRTIPSERSDPSTVALLRMHGPNTV
jgi:hypothetical protein